MRYLSNADVDALVAPADALVAVRSAFSELASGGAAQQERVRTDAQQVRLSTLGAVLPDVDVLGAKVYSTLGSSLSFAVVLFSATDGRRLAVLEADALTRLRTAATSVLATQLLARPEPRRLVVFGRGTQALAHIAGFAAAFALEEVTVVVRQHGRDPSGAIAAQTGARVTVTTDGEAAVAGADVVVTATSAKSPVLEGGWLPDGAHVTAIGSTKIDVRELDEEVFARAERVAVEWRSQARREAGGLVHAVDAGCVDWNGVVELGDVLTGRAPGRETSSGITVFQAVGVAIEDVAVAGLAWRRAEEKGTGILLE